MYRFAQIFQVLTVEEIDKESEPKTYLRPFKFVIALSRARFKRSLHHNCVQIIERIVSIVAIL